MTRSPSLLVVSLAVLLAGSLALGCRLGGPVERVEEVEGQESLYALRTLTLEGAESDLGQYRGQVALVVNVASKCGLTPQYEGLQRIHEALGPQGFTVLAFPSNDFLGQEPGDAAQIRAFCSTNYGISFPIFAKRPVTGDDRGEIYRFLTRDLEEPTWNFTKYLVDREGRVLARFPPRMDPEDSELLMAIEAALGE
jgi:glutathione peroxidase